MSFVDWNRVYMSRLGKKPIKLNTAKLTISDREIEVSGPKGTLKVPLFRGYKVEVNESDVLVSKKDVGNPDNAKWGLLRNLLNNSILGVEQGYEKKLEMIGVGYRAQSSGKKITLNVGYSHPVEILAPEGIEFIVEDNTKITVKGHDKQLVGHMASQIRSVRKPEPYKGKGIKYIDEVVRRKAGKSGKAAA